MTVQDQTAVQAVDATGWQNLTYLKGMDGTVPELPVAAAELEVAARAAMTPAAVDYVGGGAGTEATMAANRAAFDRWRLVPRMLRGAASRDLSVSLLGRVLPAPFVLSPVGVLSIVHDDAEPAVARAAAALGLPMTLSTVSSVTMEEVAAAAPAAPRWFGLYWPGDRGLAASLVARAEAAGYEAVVVTLDTWLMGWRPRDLQRAYLPFLQGQGIANYTSDPVFRSGLADDSPTSVVLRWVSLFADPTLRFDDLVFLREHTRLPIIVKGVLCAGDARRALDAGVDGIQVSNHGGRQVDRAVAALDQLPEVVDAVGARVPVLFDSGVRTAADALVALCLGADAVALGRPYVWGLGLAGEAGVRHVLTTLVAELDNQLALSGHTSVAELCRDDLRPAPRQ